MRTYELLVSRPGGFVNWPGHIISTRIRAAVAYLFRRWFGRAPDDLVWHQDGFMAEASDKRGNKVQLTQENKWLAHAPPLPVIPRPCWAIARSIPGSQAVGGLFS